jgi:hypothetical protein
MSRGAEEGLAVGFQQNLSLITPNPQTEASAAK